LLKNTTQYSWPELEPGLLDPYMAEEPPWGSCAIKYVCMCVSIDKHTNHEATVTSFSCSIISSLCVLAIAYPTCPLAEGTNEQTMLNRGNFFRGGNDIFLHKNYCLRNFLQLLNPDIGHMISYLVI